MPRLCSRCKSPLGDEPKCPRCGFQAHSPLEVRRPPRQRAGTAQKWQQTAWGKTLIGLMVSQGLYYGMMLLTRAILSAVGDDGARQALMNSFTGLLLMQVMQLVSLLIGGTLAGAGQRRGTRYGGVVGMYNGILFLLVHVAIQGNQLPVLPLVMLPILQIVFGIAGGFLGTQIWKPIQALQALPTSPEGRPALAERVALPGRRIRQSPLSGPINWPRVLLGTAVAVVGTMSAQSIFVFIKTTSAGEVDSQRQAQFLTWEISVLAMLAGGAIGGSNSNNGAKQGLTVGTLASALLVGIFIWRGDSGGTDTASWLYTFFGFEQSLLFQKVIFTILSVVPLGLAGGWFGGQLLPPLIVPPARKGMLPGTMM